MPALPVLASAAPTVVLGATKVWWYVSRASGVVAWALAALAVLWGLALSTRALGAKPKAPWLLDLHRFLGGLTIVFVGLHLVTLALDPWVSFRLDDLFVPMAASWKPGAVAWGVVAFYLLVAVELTSLVRNRIPKRLWKGVHLTSYALYAMATIHLFLAGSDKTNPLLYVTAWVSVGAVAFFTIYRVVGPGRAGSVRPARAARPERPERPERPAGAERPERPERPTRSARADRPAPSTADAAGAARRDPVAAR